MSKKALLVSTSFQGISEDTNHLGGSVFLYREAMGLVKAGVELTVLVPAIKALPLTESDAGLKVKRFTYPLMRYNSGYHGKPQHGSKGLLQRLSQVCLSIWLMYSVFRHNRKEKPSFIWANWLQVGFLCSLVSPRGKLLVTLRGSDVRENPEWLNSIMSKCCPNVLNMYPDDPEVASWIGKYKFKEISVPNVFVSKTLHHEHTDTNTIVVLGRLDGEPASLLLKGLGLTLFESLELLLNQREDFSVEVIGAGQKVEEYQAVLKQFSNRVCFHGWLSDFDEILERATFVIGASGLNGVVMDTVPYQIPVLISKNLTGTMWKHGVNCLVYDPEDAPAWSATMSQALDSKTSLFSMAESAQKDLQTFAQDWESVGQVWLRRIDDHLATID